MAPALLGRGPRRFLLDANGIDLWDARFDHLDWVGRIERAALELPGEVQDAYGVDFV